jgi:hypothetical protein
MEEGAARSEREAEAVKEELEAQKASGERRWETAASLLGNVWRLQSLLRQSLPKASASSLTTRGWSRVAEAERGRDDALKYLAKVRHDTIKRAHCC